MNLTGKRDWSAYERDSQVDVMLFMRRQDRRALCAIAVAHPDRAMAAAFFRDPSFAAQFANAVARGRAARRA